MAVHQTHTSCSHVGVCRWGGGWGGGGGGEGDKEKVCVRFVNVSVPILCDVSK